MAEFAGLVTAAACADALAAVAQLRRRILAWWAGGFDLLLTPTLSADRYRPDRGTPAAETRWGNGSPLRSCDRPGVSTTAMTGAPTTRACAARTVAPPPGRSAQHGRAADGATIAGPGPVGRVLV
jgi:hypothetical protein